MKVHFSQQLLPVDVIEVELGEVSLATCCLVLIVLLRWFPGIHVELIARFIEATKVWREVHGMACDFDAGVWLRTCKGLRNVGGRCYAVGRLMDLYYLICKVLRIGASQFITLSTRHMEA